MTTVHHVDLPDHTPVVAKAIWKYSKGTPGTLGDAHGWEMQEFWVPTMPWLTLAQRKHIEKQITPPEERP